MIKLNQLHCAFDKNLGAYQYKSSPIWINPSKIVYMSFETEGVLTSVTVPAHTIMRLSGTDGLTVMIGEAPDEIIERIANQ